MRINRSLIMTLSLIACLFALSWRVSGQDILSCENSPLKTRLPIGVQGRVTLNGAANNVRESPYLGATKLGQLPEGSTFTVVDSFACSDNGLWLMVDNGAGLVGWTVEIINDRYALEPIPNEATGQSSIPMLAPGPSLPTTTRLAFIQNNALYVLEPGSTTPLLIDGTPTYDYSAVWSPDGSKLAYLVSADGGVYSRVTLKVWDGSQSIDLVTDFRQASAMPISWTRDGKILYMVNVGESGQEFLSLETYTIAPIGGSTPELVTTQASIRTGCGGGYSLPMDQVIDGEGGYGGRFFLQLAAYGLVYSSDCRGGTSLFRMDQNEQIPFYGEQLTDLALSVDQRTVAGILTNFQEQTTSLGLINLETLEESTPSVQHFPRQLAWDSSGNLYYSSYEQVSNLMDGLSPDDQASFVSYGYAWDSPQGPLLPQNGVGIYRLALDGTETTVFEGLDAYNIGRMQVVGTRLYFSTVSNGNEWMAVLLNGALDRYPSDEANQYVHTTIYMVDLTVPNDPPHVVVTDAAQFAAAGQ